MKQLKYFVPMFALVALASCQQNEQDSVSVAENATELNLQSFSYDEIKALAEGNEASHSIRLIDGDVVKEISYLKKNDKMEVIDDEYTPTFYKSANEDSICVIVSKEYASIKFNYKGEELGYVACTNQEMIANYMAACNEVSTRSGEGNTAVTRSSTNPESFKINMTKLAKDANKSFNCTVETIEDEENTMQSSEPSPSTRTAYYTQWPRGNTLTIHLVRDQGNSPIEWELDWQVNNLSNSLRNIRYDLNVKVWRSNTGYRSSSSNSVQSLSDFRSYCNSSSFPWREATNHDIICLVRYSTYSDALGRAYYNGYKLSRYDNNWAYAVVGTSSLYTTKSLAHEVGHILGANHVSGRPWWQFWLSDDVMVSSASWRMGVYHQDAHNYNTIWNNLY